MIADFKSVIDCIDSQGKALKGIKVVVCCDGHARNMERGTVVDAYRRDNRLELYVKVRFKDYSVASFELRDLAQPLI